jgi:hypothetical protein
MSVTAVPLHPIRKGSVVKLWLGLAFLALIAVAAAWAGTRGLLYTATESGLKFRVLKEGEGATPAPTDVAFVTYTGRLPDGTVFDSNVGQQPAPFPVAEGATIKGFSEALRMMKKGGSYSVVIPPALAYGEKDMGRIPPNSTLEFEVTMHGFMPEEQLRAIMMQQQMGMGGGPQGEAGETPPEAGAGAEGPPPGR